jgi:hypothetical protein
MANGAKAVGSLGPFSSVFIERDGGGTFAKEDFVKSDGSGEVVVGTAGATILGVANEAGTSSSENVQINVTPYLVVIMDNDEVGGAFAATNVGDYGDFIGGTGAMQVDTSDLSTTKAQLYTLAYNPQGFGFDADTSVGKFLVVETEMSGQAAA